MAVGDLIQQARARFGQAPSVLLRADQPTGKNLGRCSLPTNIPSSIWR